MISFCSPRNHRKLPAAITTADATYCSISPRTECESRVQAIRCCLCAHDQLSKRSVSLFCQREIRQLSPPMRHLFGGTRATGSGVTLHVVAPFFFFFFFVP